MEKRKYFIAGGAGFIGSHLARTLLSQGYASNIVIFDNFSSGTFQHIEDISKDERVAVINADIKNLGELTHSMQGAQAVFHFAANPDIAKAARQPDIDFWDGTYLTNNVLEAMRINSVPFIVYSSGSGVYGEDPKTCFKENHGPCHPISTYGASKLACEALISSYCHMFSMRGGVLRFANVVGPRQTHGVGYDFVRRLLKNPDELQILGDGNQLKSYVFVTDVISAMLKVHDLFMNSENKKIYEVYNIASGDYITVKQIADIAVKVAGLDAHHVKYLYTGGERGWKGDVPVIKFDAGEIRKLGWRPEHTSASAIEKSIQSMHREMIHGPEL